MLDNQCVRGIVLALIRAYQNINEAEFEETIALLQSAPDEQVRDEAASITRIWEGSKSLDVTTHAKLIRHRLRLIDDGVQRLEVITRPKE